MGRVWFVNRYFYPDTSATSQLVTQLCRHLADRDMQCVVITSRQLYEDRAARLPVLEQSPNLEVRRVWSSRFGRQNLAGRALDYLSFYLSSAWLVLRAVHRRELVVAMTDPPMLGLALILPCRLRGAFLINWLQDLFPEIAERLAPRGWLAPVLRGLLPLRDWSLRQAVTNVAVGRCMQSYLRGRNISTVCIVNWAGGNRIRPVAREENRLRREWGLGNRFVVGYSGNFGRVHTFDAMLRAGELLATRADILILCVGGGQQYAWLKHEARARGLLNWVFKPYQMNDLLSFSLSAPDLHLVTQHPAIESLVVPSKWYGIAAAARPTVYVGAPEGEIAQVIRESDCGWVLSPKDGDALAALISHCAGHQEECRLKGAAAFAAYQQRYSPQRAFSEWSGLLARLTV